MTDTADTIPDTGSTTRIETATDTGKTGLADSLRKHFSGDAPLTEKIKSFAKARPWASGMLVGIAGVLLAGTLRGKRRL